MLVFLSQFASLVSIVGTNSDNRAVISAHDDDAQMVIYKATITRWYKENGWFSYGPFYFRLAHTLNFFVPLTSYSQSAEPFERNEQSLHFQLMLISLTSLTLLCFLLATLVTPSWVSRIALSSLLLGAFLTNREWTNFILRAHPDLLFSLLISLSVLISFKSIMAPKDKSLFAGAGILWGLAASTKLTIVLFVPMLLIFWLVADSLLAPAGKRPPFQQSIKKTLHFLSWILLSYFLIGFPQNFSFWRSIQFLNYQSQFSSLATSESILDWFRYLWGQTALPLAILLLGHCLWGVTKVDPRGKKTWTVVTLLSLLPFVFLISRKVISQNDYYTLPFAAYFLVLVALGLKFNFLWLQNKVQNFLTGSHFLKKSWQNRLQSKAYLVPILALGLGSATYGLAPEVVNEMLAEQMTCRNEARAIYAKVKEFASEGKVVFVDPYVPYPRAEKDKNIFVSWRKDFRELETIRPSVLIFNQNFYRRYLQGERPSQYTIIDAPNWPEVRKFYFNFDGKTETKDQRGRQWHQTYEDNCGRRIWQLKSELPL